MYSRISGTGSYLPKKILTNADLEKLVDTSDEWIRTRTGIEQRRPHRDLGRVVPGLIQRLSRRSVVAE